MISTGRIRPSLNEFKMYFNERAKHIRPHLTIRQIELNYKHRFPMFFIPISETDVIFGCLQPVDGTIHHVAIVRRNCGEKRSRLEFLITTALLLDSIKPHMDREEKKNVFERLRFFDEQVDLCNARVFASFKEFDLMLLSSLEASFFSLTVMYR